MTTPRGSAEPDDDDDEEEEEEGDDDIDDDVVAVGWLPSIAQHAVPITTTMATRVAAVLLVVLLVMGQASGRGPSAGIVLRVEATQPSG
ncbi:hypothetical protein ITJ54_07095 [Curtobacterium sp. VKM Ac-2865]|nr:hypothetical protein [Curtobacterium sp. VKM Ac-2865]